MWSCTLQQNSLCFSSFYAISSFILPPCALFILHFTYLQTPNTIRCHCGWFFFLRRSRPKSQYFNGVYYYYDFAVCVFKNHNTIWYCIWIASVNWKILQPYTLTQTNRNGKYCTKWEQTKVYFRILNEHNRLVKRKEEIRVALACVQICHISHFSLLLLFTMYLFFSSMHSHY